MRSQPRLVADRHLTQGISAAICCWSDPGPTQQTSHRHRVDPSVVCVRALALYRSIPVEVFGLRGVRVATAAFQQLFARTLIASPRGRPTTRLVWIGSNRSAIPEMIARKIAVRKVIRISRDAGAPRRTGPAISARGSQ
jgi:hypothetical protein